MELPDDMPWCWHLPVLFSHPLCVVSSTSQKKGMPFSVRAFRGTACAGCQGLERPLIPEKASCLHSAHTSFKGRATPDRGLLSSPGIFLTLMCCVGGRQEPRCFLWTPSPLLLWYHQGIYCASRNIFGNKAKRHWQEIPQASTLFSPGCKLRVTPHGFHPLTQSRIRVFKIC